MQLSRHRWHLGNKVLLRGLHARSSSARRAHAGGLLQVSDQLTELKLGNGTSILITANIASALPTSVGAALQSAASKDQSNLAVYAVALFATTLGVVYVQVCPARLDGSGP